jgi:cytochrome c-type biogenesis protein CcmE
MKPKHQRLVFLGVAVAMIAGATALILNTFQDSIVFFYSPSDVITKHPEAGKAIRIGGLVEKGTVQHPSAQEVTFTTTDYKNTLTVRYKGELPALFREGQGVVAEGALEQDGSFTATKILAKHDENYMPPEVARAIKDSGQWKDGNPATSSPDASATPATEKPTP